MSDWQPGDPLLERYNASSFSAHQPMVKLKDDLFECKVGSCALCYPDNPWPALRSDHMTVTFERKEAA